MPFVRDNGITIKENTPKDTYVPSEEEEVRLMKGLIVEEPLPAGYIPPKQVALLDHLEKITDSINLKKYYNKTHQRKTLTGIEWWMGNKIRIELGKIKNRHGYPVKRAHKVTFNSLLYVATPYNYIIDEHGTNLEWKDNPQYQWRYVITMKIIVDSPWNEFVFGILNTVTMGAMEGFYKIFDRKVIPVYENYLFYNTIHDVIIFMNWEKVRLDLIKHKL